MPAVKPIPKGYHSVTPFLVVQGAAKVIDFLQEAFEARQVERMDGPGGTVMHAELTIGDSRVMISDATAEFGPMPSSLYVYVPDTDATYQKALRAGGASLREPTDQFYGDRNAGVRDTAGNMWWIATRKEEVSTEELQRRIAAMRQRAAG
ncbi:MAG TPA: VOC family protein [Bryobacteraceae bacterium]|nr:VOC family protein [Bryobacteraceae bacterium]